MSTFLDGASLSKPIHSLEDLHGYFQMFAKPAGGEKVGIECELFGVETETGAALSYSGERGIERVLNELAYEFGYEKIEENGRIIALQKGDTFISLEPGGQIELSAEPVKSIHQVKAQLDEFLFSLRTIAGFVGGIEFLACGLHPFSSLRQIEWVPKERYQIMSRHLGRKGKRSHDMMKRTATDQVNLDYTSEADAIEKMRLALRLTPIAAAMFAHSGFANGKPTRYVSERLAIWRRTDPDRCGLVLNLVCSSCSFQDYFNYVLDVPMMFIVRGGKWIVTRNLTFRRFIEKGFEGARPTQSDFKLHLSTIFTEARFKQYLEIRGMDGQRSHLIPAVSAFWKGILYDEEALRNAKNLVKNYREPDVLSLHEKVERLGLKARIAGDRILELARELVKISEKGLSRRQLFNEREEDERIYLAPLKEEVLREGKTPAEKLNELWNGPFKRDRKSLIDYLKI